MAQPCQTAVTKLAVLAIVIFQAWPVSGLHLIPCLCPYWIEESKTMIGFKCYMKATENRCLLFQFFQNPPQKSKTFANFSYDTKELSCFIKLKINELKGDNVRFQVELAEKQDRIGYSRKMWLTKDLESTCLGTCSTDCQPCNDKSRLAMECWTGYKGPDCQQECSDGTFGSNCTGKCNCRDSEICEKSCGLCKSGCAAGWLGQGCQNECPDGRFGQDCVNKCKCQSKCDKVSGECLNNDTDALNLKTPDAQESVAGGDDEGSHMTPVTIAEITFGVLAFWVIVGLYVSHHNSKKKRKRASKKEAVVMYLEKKRRGTLHQPKPESSVDLDLEASVGVSVVDNLTRSDVHRLPSVASTSV